MLHVLIHCVRAIIRCGSCTRAHCSSIANTKSTDLSLPLVSIVSAGKVKIGIDY